MADSLDNSFSNDLNPHEKPAGKAKTFSCPNCGGSIAVKAVGHSISAVCMYCSSVIDVTNENYRILKTANERTRPTLLTIGSRGRLAGILWEVIGYMEKTDNTGFYRWEEYLLYNPYQGFRFLVQTKGHWSLFKILKKSITELALSREITIDGIKYWRFQNGWTKVAYVKGEFYWRAQEGERSLVTDYVAPPYLLSISHNDQEINAALGEYIEAETIEKAFVLSSRMPYQSGVATNQPNPYPAEKVIRIWLTTAASFLLATLIQIVTAFSAANATVYESRIDIPAAEKNQTFSTESFSLPKQSNLQVATQAWINDDWLELDLALVNEQENTVKEAKQALEYYSGVDYEGYQWSEGEQNTKTLFAAVPKGIYRLLIDADTNVFQTGLPITFYLHVKRDVTNWSNYAITLLLLLIYPGYVTFRYKYIESSRWSESDFENDDLR